MANNEKKKNTLTLKDIDSIQKQLALFFPEEAYSFTRQAIEDGMDSGEFFVKPLDMLPYIQTALFDDKILEVEMDGLTRVYFSRIYDDLPDLEEVKNEVAENQLNLPVYKPGDYLKLMTHLICMPLEPGMGNLYIRNSKNVVLRFLTSNNAIELGAFFQNIGLVHDIPVLRLSFPAIGRQVKGARIFRAKVPVAMNFSLLINGNNKLRSDIETRALDISCEGLSFIITKEEQQLFKEDEICSIRVYLDGEMNVTVCCKIRHISKVREKKGIQYRCGVQFDLSTRSLASDIETIVATVQRAHLKELSDKSEESGINLIK